MVPRHTCATHTVQWDSIGFTSQYKVARCIQSCTFERFPSFSAPWVLCESAFKASGGPGGRSKPARQCSRGNAGIEEAVYLTAQVVQYKPCARGAQEECSCRSADCASSQQDAAADLQIMHHQHRSTAQNLPCRGMQGQGRGNMHWLIRRAPQVCGQPVGGHLHCWVSGLSWQHHHHHHRRVQQQNGHNPGCAILVRSRTAGAAQIGLKASVKAQGKVQKRPHKQQQQHLLQVKRP